MVKELTKFRTDGCSGNMSWFWRKIVTVHNFFVKESDRWSVLLPWHDACVEHDRTYHVGGTYLQRLVADIQLMATVAEMGYPIVAVSMFLSIQLGGYGWRAEVGYRLTKMINWKAIRYNWGYGWGPGYRYKGKRDV